MRVTIKIDPETRARFIFRTLYKWTVPFRLGMIGGGVRLRDDGLMIKLNKEII